MKPVKTVNNAILLRMANNRYIPFDSFHRISCSLFIFKNLQKECRKGVGWGNNISKFSCWFLLGRFISFKFILARQSLLFPFLFILIAN